MKPALHSDRDTFLDLAQSGNVADAVAFQAQHQHDFIEIINATNSTGENALILATEYNHPEMVNFLIEHGADANISVTTENKNLPALFFAVMNDNKENITKLLPITSRGNIKNTLLYSYGSRFSSGIETVVDVALEHHCNTSLLPEISEHLASLGYISEITERYLLPRPSSKSKTASAKQLSQLNPNQIL